MAGTLALTISLKAQYVFQGAFRFARLGLPNPGPKPPDLSIRREQLLEIHQEPHLIFLVRRINQCFQIILIF
jgi:hypothetical protein